MKKKGIIIVGAIVLVWAGVVGFVLLNDKSKKTETAKSSIERYTIPQSKKVIVNGIVTPKESKNYYQAAGAKVDIKVKDGDKVRKGDLLISYNDGAVKEYAPFDGNVYVSKEADGSTTSPILKIRSNDFYIKAQTTEKDLANIKVDANAKILILSTNKNIDGKVTAVSDEPQSQVSVQQGATGASLAVSNYDLSISLDNKDGIVNGYHVQATISTEDKTIKIPKESVLKEDGKNYVYIIKDKKMHKQEVKTSEDNSDFVKITSGANEKDEIVKKPTKDMKEGQSVE